MISFLRYFFNVNYELIYFIYGLTFFVLGLAIALQSRHSSHLELARCLNWLAAFGFLHGFNEWGDLFIPLQSVYLAPQVIRILQYLHLLLLALSFVCLYGFGLALLETIGHPRWLHIVFAALLACGTVLALWPFRMTYTDFNTWYNAVSALTRYLVGLPSGLLAAYALREHTLKRIAPYNVPRIYNALQVSGITMAIYALAAGLIVPPAPFFPANWLNTATFAEYLVIPIMLFRALVGLAMALTTIRFLEIFDVETSRQIEAMQGQRAMADERERIARELHDGTIQKVYTAGLLVRSAEKLAEPESPLAGRLATAVGVLDDAIGELRQDLKQLHTLTASPEPLKLAIQKMATDPRFNTLVSIDFNLDLPDAYTLSSERTTQVMAILQEALANIVRHAHARHVSINADRADGNFRMVITDDGIGIQQADTAGQGLRNMQDRALLLHGELRVEKLARGTSVTLEIPGEPLP